VVVLGTGGICQPPRSPYAGYAFTPDVVSGAEIEMEHLRAPNRGPSGTGMAGVFLWDTPGNCRLEAHDESLKRELFQNAAAWNIGIAQFPPGRLRETTALRKFPSGFGGTTGTLRRLSGRTVERSRAAHRERGGGTASAKTENDLSEIGGAVARRAGRPSADLWGERSLRKRVKRITSKSFGAKTGGGGPGAKETGRRDFL
jgi:hypothetical protein